MALFSKRYDKALNERVLRPSLPMRLRKRIWATLQGFDHEYSYRPDPRDNWVTTTSVLEELPHKLKAEYGADHLLAYVDDSRDRAPTDLEGLVLRGWPSHVLDVIEQVFADLPDDRKYDFQREINRVMGEEGSPWRLADGQFLQIDSEFLALELERAQTMLKTHGFAGAYDEFREARLDLTAGDYKGAIRNACNALESTMKVIIGVDSGNASVLIRKLVEDGFFDELPETMQSSFGEQVLMSLPAIGNRLARHGQGHEVIEIPRHYAELAVALSAALMTFCVQRSLGREAAAPVEIFPAPAEDFAPPEDDDIPF